MSRWRWLVSPSGPAWANSIGGALLRWLWDAPIAAHTLGAIAAALTGRALFGLGGCALGLFVMLLATVWQLAKWDDHVYGRDWPAEIALRLLIALPWAVGFGIAWR